MKTLPVKQGSEEWKAARLGVVTASEIDALITPLWKVRTGEGPETYRCMKLCEKLLGYSPEDAGTFAMDQGSLVETLARPWYSFQYNVEVQTVGFCVSDDGKIGCSPDGLIGDDCGLEIKCPQPPRHLKYLMAGEIPPEYRAQVHFSMYVTGRPKWKFLSYSRQFPALVVNVERDPKIDAAIKCALDVFFESFDATYAKLKAMKDAENEAKARAYYKSEGIAV